MASTCAPSLAANQWAWLKPHPQLLAEGAAIAVALHDRCRRGHRRPRRRCNCRRRHCWRAAAAAGPPPHFCYQTAVNESQKCIFFLCRALPRTPSQAELDMSAIFTPLMSCQTPELGLSADPGPRRPRSGKKRDLTRSTAKGRLLVPRSPLTKTTRQVGLRPVLAVCAPRAQSVRLGANPHREPLLPQRATSRRIT